MSDTAAASGDIVQAAFALARTGNYERREKLEAALRKKGFAVGDIEEHLHGKAIRSELRKIMKDARPSDP